MLTKLRVKLYNFFDKYKFHIIIAIAGIMLLNIITQYIKLIEIRVSPKITKEPYVAVMDESITFSDNVGLKGEKLIRNFLELANDQKFDEALNLVSEDCKHFTFRSPAEALGYLAVIFDNKVGKKAYDIQAYNKIGDVYIYQVKIFEDFLKSGMTNQKYEYLDLKFSLKYENGKYNLGIKSYIDYKDIKGVYEDNNVKIELLREIINYNYEKYIVRITNRTKEKLVVYDNQQSKTPQIQLQFGNEKTDKRKIMQIPVIKVDGLKTVIAELPFDKLYNGIRGEILEFSALRFYNKYIPVETHSGNINQEKPVNEYSVKVKVER